MTSHILEGAAASAPEKALEEPGLKMFLYFSQLIGRQVLNSDGKSIGRLVDLKVNLGALFPKMRSLVVRRKRTKPLWELDWACLDSLNTTKIALVAGAEDRVKPLTVANDELLLREELLDRQVVDTGGAKIERVNDVHLLIVNRDLHIVHVDFGFRGIIRRLGVLKSIDSFTQWFFGYRFPDKLISWKYVQPLVADLRNSGLKLNVTARSIHDLHPSDLADILEDLDRANRDRLFEALDVETAADALEEVDDSKLQADLLDGASLEQASDILEEMAPDEATDLLADLPEHKQRSLIQTMEKDSRDAVVALLRYKEGTAGSIMTKDFFSVPDSTSVGRAIEEFRRTTLPLESVAYIYVTAGAGVLSGVCTLRHLIIADKDATLGSLMNPHLIRVDPEDKVGDVASIFKKYKFLALPVVDKDGVQQGLITLKDFLQEELEE